MEELILIMFLLVTLQTSLRMGFLKFSYAFVFGLLVAGFNFWMYPFLLNQGNAFIPTLFTNTDILQNLVLLVIAEGLLFMYAGAKQTSVWIYPAREMKRVDKWLLKSWGFPGLTIFAASFYFLHRYLLWSEGIDFEDMAFLICLTPSVVLLWVIVGMRFLLNHPLLRLELSIVLLALQMITVVILLNFQRSTVVPVEMSLPLLPLLTFLFISLCISATGYYFTLKKHRK